MRDRRDAGGRGGVPWWAPLLGLPLLAGAVAAVALATGDSTTGRAAPRPADRGAVLGMQTMVTRAAHQTPRTKKAQVVVGRPFHARRVRVLDVVGRKIFWIRTAPNRRLLVHLQGPRRPHRIERGQRLTFTGVYARNRPGTAAAWGLAPVEGRAEFLRQGVHLEVYRPHVTIAAR